MLVVFIEVNQETSLKLLMSPVKAYCSRMWDAFYSDVAKPEVWIS